MPLTGEAKRQYNKRYRAELKKDAERYIPYLRRRRAQNRLNRKKEGPIAILIGRILYIRF